MADEEEQIKVKLNPKKKCGYEVEKRKDGYFYISAVPKKSSVRPGDRVLEINGISYKEFKTAKKANELFEQLILNVVPADEDQEEDEEEEEGDDEEYDDDDGDETGEYYDDDDDGDLD